MAPSPDTQFQNTQIVAGSTVPGHLATKVKCSCPLCQLPREGQLPTRPPNDDQEVKSGGVDLWGTFQPGHSKAQACFNIESQWDAVLSIFRVSTGWLHPNSRIAVGSSDRPHFTDKETEVEEAYAGPISYISQSCNYSVS